MAVRNYLNEEKIYKLIMFDYGFYAKTLVKEVFMTKSQIIEYKRNAVIVGNKNEVIDEYLDKIISTGSCEDMYFYEVKFAEEIAEEAIINRVTMFSKNYEIDNIKCDYYKVSVLYIETLDKRYLRLCSFKFKNVLTKTNQGEWLKGKFIMDFTVKCNKSGDIEQLGYFIEKEFESKEDLMNDIINSSKISVDSFFKMALL